MGADPDSVSPNSVIVRASLPLYVPANYVLPPPPPLSELPPPQAASITAASTGNCLKIFMILRSCFSVFVVIRGFRSSSGKRGDETGQRQTGVSQKREMQGTCVREVVGGFGEAIVQEGDRRLLAKHRQKGMAEQLNTRLPASAGVRQMRIY